MTSELHPPAKGKSYPGLPIIDDGLEIPVTHYSAGGGRRSSSTTIPIQEIASQPMEEEVADWAAKPYQEDSAFIEAHRVAEAIVATGAAACKGHSRCKAPESQFCAKPGRRRAHPYSVRLLLLGWLLRMAQGLVLILYHSR